MSTSTQRKKRAKTSGTNAINSAVATATATTTQVNAMKNEFDVRLSQLTNIQRDQQYQLEILRGENTKLVKRNDEMQLLADENKELRRELNQMKETMNSDKTEYEAKINEMKNEFKKQLEDLKQKDSTGDSRSGSSVMAYGNYGPSNTEGTVTQEIQSRITTTMNNNDVKNIKVTKEILLHAHCIFHVLIFTSKNNEKMVATASQDESIKITRLNDNEVVSTIWNAHAYAVNSLVMTKINNNEVIASCGRDRMVKFWSIDNFEEVASFKCCYRVLSLAAYELNGKYMLACGSWSGVSGGLIELWDVQSMKKVNTLKGHCIVDALHNFKHQNKTYLLSGDFNGKLNLWCLDYDNNKLVKALCSSGDGICSFATFDLDNDLFIAAGVGKKVILWKMNNLQLYHQFDCQGDSGICGLKSFMSNGRAMLATVGLDGLFHVLDVQEKKVVHKFRCEDHKFYSLDVFEEDGNCVLIVGEESRRKKGSIVFLK